MRKTLVIAAAFLVLCSPLKADYREGEAAYKRGEFNTTLREYRAAANRRHASAQWRKRAGSAPSRSPRPGTWANEIGAPILFLPRSDTNYLFGV